MSWKKSIKRFWDWFCAVAVLAIVLVILGKLSGFWHSPETVDPRVRVHDWPKTNGTIVDAKIVLRDESGEYRAGLCTSVTGHLHFTHPSGEKTVSFQVAAAPRFAPDWEGSFKPGGQVAIRYNPEKQEELSFIDFTGEP